MVIGNHLDNNIYYKADGTWLPSFSFWSYNTPKAFNPYSGDRVSIAYRNKSFDAFDGGDGNDVLYLTNASDAIFLDDSLSLNSGKDGQRIANIETINAGDGDDVIDLSSNKYTYGNVTLNGGNGNDVLWSNDGNDILNGDAGNDTIKGYDGDDIIKGGIGNDTIDGGKDNDKITGGLGADILSGGIGNDVFIYENIADSTRSNPDPILGFIQNQDKIDLSQIAEINSLDDLNIIFQNNQTLIEAQDHDFQIKLNQQIQLTEQDFLFS